ncbi:hypothetical protein EDC96DRAFT_487256 [Choanephora cucurbitarum]|nr:hypothetical protein EDC96DRAFT_487256 [Choanephora cucurbitarum]
MSTSPTRIVYNLANIETALVSTEVSGVLSLPLNETVCVVANEWKECFNRISELSATKWIKKRSRSAENLIMGESRECHRRGQRTPTRTVRISQKDSKKIGCRGTLSILQYIQNPGVVELKMSMGHVNHVPGSNNDIRTLPLTRETVTVIERNLRNGSNCGDIRTAVLRQIEQWECGRRKPTCENVYNRIKKVRNNKLLFEHLS